MRFLFLLLSVTICVQTGAQQKWNVNEKISPNLAKIKTSLNKIKQQDFFVVSTDVNAFKRFLSARNLHTAIVSEYETTGLLVLKLNWQLIDSLLLPSPLVKFIDVVRVPKEETIIDGFDLSTNKINLAHQLTSINGSGTVLSVKENKPDVNDIDLRGRFLPTALSAPNISSHATIMSTIIAGGGNSDHTAKGVAWGATISSSDFVGLLPDTDDDYKKHSISVQNHSYGTAIENYYGADAAAYDVTTISNPFLLHVFSAGNSGDKIGTAGPYAGISGYANLTGSFKMAKNIVTVGSVDSLYRISLLSSKGPAYDGRVKPELVAFGMDGSSGAAAIVSGTALLLQQGYKEQNNGQLPAAALIRSILLNTADDIGPKEIDFQSGYGSLNAYRALEGMVNKRYFAGSLSQGQLQRFTLDLPSNVRQLKITVCWNDPPANANDNKALVNDLDLRLVHALSAHSWLPWVLNAFSHPDSLKQVPMRNRDSINNTEQITLDNPAPGTYEIEINGFRIPQGFQSYYISYQWDTVNQFKWQYPTASDPVFRNQNNILRWTSTFPPATGRLYYSLDSGISWELIADNLELDKNYYQWAAPDSFSTVIFRMLISQEAFNSDTAVVSSRLGTGIGFNCPDSFLIYWDKIGNNKSSYVLYQLGTKYLEPLKSINDTSIILNKSSNAALHYAVAPVINGRAGMKSYTFNYETQGTGCYIKGFLADLINNAATIRLDLGTRYGIERVIIEKWTRNGFLPIRDIPAGLALRYNFVDDSLLTGGNIYRARIDLNNGKTIYSLNETIYYLPETDYLVYPNPATTDFTIVSKDLDNAELILYNSVGQKVLVKKLTSPVERIPASRIKSGVYFISIKQKDKKDYRSAIIIQ
jgi:Subtilase family/Secretion system C-terminal sorting domain